MTHPNKIVAWATAIQQWEGAESVLNNPGNLKYSALTKSWGASPGRPATDGGSIASFPSYSMGFNALCQFLELGCENLLLAFHSPAARTLGGFTRVYAGNPPQGYVDGIVHALGATEATPISSFLS